MEKVMITMPAQLLQNTDQVATDVGENRSQFIREAIQMRMAYLQQMKFKALLAEGYQEMAYEYPSEAASIQAEASDSLWVWDDE